MRWLPQISFSSPSSSPSSSLSSSSLKPVASFSESPDLDRNQDRDRFHRRLFRFNRGRLTRQRKLRHLTDDDVLGERRPSTSSSSAVDVGLTRSPSAFTVGPRSPSAVPLPLPLPLPEIAGDSRNRNAGNGRGLEGRDRDPDRVIADRTSSGPPLTSVNGFARDSRRATENSPYQDYSCTNSPRNRNSYWVNIPTMSAPTSPYMSPVPSPQRKSTGQDLPFFYLPPKSNQAWSAPDMPLDTSLLPPPAYYDITAFSTDNSPIHSPQPRSPRNRPVKSPQPSRPSSPLHSILSPDQSAAPRDSVSSPLHPRPDCPRLSTDVTNGRRDNSNVHPLPLPPGAACPSSAAAASVPCPQAPLKVDSFPMNSQWKKGKLIGRGTFGSVYVASNSETGALCAMKEVELYPDDPKSAESIKQLEQEIRLLSNLQHPNIVQYFGSEIVEDRFFIYLEYVHPGSINKYIREHCGTMTESVVRNFTRHILSGLAYLHNKKTVHRDIKGANLLVDASGVVKLADFGMAKHLTGQRADLSLKGSPYWMAPELMQAVMQKDSNPDLAFAVDIWSLGCTIIEMFTGKPPWSEFEGAAAMFKVMRDSPPVPESMSPEGKDFLRLCFQRNPAERPTASMLLEHRFLKNSLQPTSPRNSDVSNCAQLLNGMNITEPNSRREKPNFKLDQVPRARNMTSSESESGQQQHQHQQQQYRSPDLTTGTATRLSPRSTLEAIPSPSPSQRPKLSSDRRRTCIAQDHS